MIGTTKPGVITGGSTYLTIHSGTANHNLPASLELSGYGSTDQDIVGRISFINNQYSQTGTEIARVSGYMTGVLGQGGLSFSTTKIGQGLSEKMRLDYNGNLGIGTTSPLATLHVVGQYGSNAALIVNQLNNGDLFTASYSGATKFTITNQGGINLGGTVGLGSNCLLGGTTASWGSCSTGVGISPFTEVTGVNGGYITANNSTEDFLFVPRQQVLPLSICLVLPP